MALHLCTGDESVSRLHGCRSLGGFDEWTFLCLDGLCHFSGWVDLVLNGELGKGKAVRHDDGLCCF